jgi:hypothetical protein
MRGRNSAPRRGDPPASNRSTCVDRSESRVSALTGALTATPDGSSGDDPREVRLSVLPRAIARTSVRSCCAGVGSLPDRFGVPSMITPTRAYPYIRGHWTRLRRHGPLIDFRDRSRFHGLLGWSACSQRMQPRPLRQRPGRLSDRKNSAVNPYPAVRCTHKCVHAP